MKVASSLKTLKSRDRNCQVVRRRGRLYVINKEPAHESSPGLIISSRSDERRLDSQSANRMKILMRFFVCWKRSAGQDLLKADIR